MPGTALEAWLEAAGITEGAVFRRVLNRRVRRVTDQRLAARMVASVVKLPQPSFCDQTGARVHAGCRTVHRQCCGRTAVKISYQQL